MKKLKLMLVGLVFLAAITSFTSVSANEFEDCPDVIVKNEK